MRLLSEFVTYVPSYIVNDVSQITRINFDSTSTRKSFDVIVQR
uniref:Uncharacterized protein n=1 Tax=Anguilla anguilla TaxID=7936 RepID=A0A0E9QLC9_ANGAN